MAANLRHTFPLIDLARITGGRIVATHVNSCPSFDGGPCNCAVAEFRVVRSRPARKARVTR
jgi:hypothetical protein